MNSAQEGFEAKLKSDNETKIHKPYILKYFNTLEVGAYYNRPKFNCQPESGTDDFPIKYGPKTLKHPWSISKKTLGHFEITF